MTCPELQFPNPWTWNLQNTKIAKQINLPLIFRFSATLRDSVECHKPLRRLRNACYVRCMLAKVNNCAIIGLRGDAVEVDISDKRLPAFNTVGLPDTTVQEARPRSGPWWG